MGSVKNLTNIIPAVALAVGLSTPMAANAADILIDPPVVEAPEVQPISNSGWYLRGDITYDFRSADPGTYYPAAEMFTNTSIDDTWDVGLGIGYQINDNFRVDVTGEYVFDSTWMGNSYDANFACPGAMAAGGGSAVPAGVPGTCNSADMADVSMFKLLANAYWDVGKFGGFTPYVGAGIGGAYVMYGDLKQDMTGQLQCCDPVNGGPIAVTGRTIHKGEDSWRFAYALHAGFSYDLTHSLKLDLGYTYSDITGGPIAQYIDRAKPQAYDDGFQDHVIRAGLRYQIW